MSVQFGSECHGVGRSNRTLDARVGRSRGLNTLFSFGNHCLAFFVRLLSPGLTSFVYTFFFFFFDLVNPVALSNQPVFVRSQSARESEVLKHRQ